MDTIKKLTFLLGKKKTINFLLLILLLIISVIFETLSILMIFPLMRLVSNAENYIEDIGALKFIYNLFNFESTNSFLISVSTTLICLLTIINLFRIWVNHVKFSFIGSEHSVMSTRLLTYYLGEKYTYWLTKNKGDVIRTVSSDVDILFNKIVTKGLSLCTDALLVVLIVLFLFIIDVKLTFMILLIGGLIGSVLLFFNKKSRKLFDEQRNIRSQMMVSLKQVVLTGPEIKGAGRETEFIDSFSKQVNRLTKNIQAYKLNLQIPAVFTQTFRVYGILTILLYVLISQQDIGELLPVLLVHGIGLLRIIPATNRILKSYFEIRIFKSSLTTIFHELKSIGCLSNLRTDSANESVEVTEKGSIVLKDVNYQYSGKKAHSLTNISFSIPLGAKIAITGVSGVGKTTLGELIAGLIYPDSGQVLINDIEIHQIPKLWRNMVGYVPKTTTIINESIRKNIAFGQKDEEIDDAKVWRSLELVGLKDFVSELQNQLHTPIGKNPSVEMIVEDFDGDEIGNYTTTEAKVNYAELSPNQNKLIGIARVLYRNPSIVVMDESTATFDEELERKILEAVEGKTVILITKKPRPLKYCDVIFEVVEGQVVSKNINP